MSRIFLHEPSGAPEKHGLPLSDLGHEVLLCRDRQALFDGLAEGRPDLLVYVLSSLRDDLALLTMIRRLDQKLPLIVLSESSDLQTRRSIQELRPTYFGVLPLDPSELADVAASALEHTQPSAIHSHG